MPPKSLTAASHLVAGLRHLHPLLITDPMVWLVMAGGSNVYNNCSVFFTITFRIYMQTLC